MSKFSMDGLDFGNKSWADIVFEEEEEEKRREEQKSRKKKEKVKFKESSDFNKLGGESLKTTRSSQNKEEDNVWRDRLRSPVKKPCASSSPRSSKSNSRAHSSGGRKSPISPKQPSTRTPKRLQQEEEKRRPVASPRRTFASPVKKDDKRNTRSSPVKPWRTKKVIDDDSQDTLTESAQIRNVATKRSHSLIEDDGETRFGFVDRSRDDGLDNRCGQGNVKRVRRSSDTRRLSGPPKGFPRPNDWIEPKNGYETDPAIIARKEKDINYGYKSEVYKKYVEAVPRAERTKGVHPRTPNKYIKQPRRSWDMQVRLWRRMLYYTMNMEPPSSDCSFLSTTTESSETQSANVSFTSVGEVDVDGFSYADADFPSLVDECTEATVTGTNNNSEGPTNFASMAMAAAR